MTTQEFRRAVHHEIDPERRIARVETGIGETKMHPEMREEH